LPRKKDWQKEVPDAPAATDVKKSDKLYSGNVKRYSERNGIGFIDCEASRDEFNKDVRIFREEFEELKLQVGDPVSFRVVLSGRTGCPVGQPYATDVKRVNDGSEGFDNKED